MQVLTMVIVSVATILNALRVADGSTSGWLWLLFGVVGSGLAGVAVLAVAFYIAEVLPQNRAISRLANKPYALDGSIARAERPLDSVRRMAAEKQANLDLALPWASVDEPGYLAGEPGMLGRGAGPTVADFERVLARPRALDRVLRRDQ